MSGSGCEFGPQTRRDPRSFVLLSLCALGWLGIAYDLQRGAPEGEAAGVAGMLAVAALTFGVGLATWWFSPRAQGRLVVSEGGIFFEQWRGVVVPAQELPWDGIGAVRLKRGAWGRTRLGIVSRPPRTGRAAHVWWLDLAGLDLGGRDVVQAIGEGAERAGFGLRAGGKARGGAGRTGSQRVSRWQLYPLRGQGR